MGVEQNLDECGMSAETNDITEDEAALYDRQIRLWGLDCQKRLREAKVLVIGLNGLGAEVVKNLTLSGMKSITIMDNTKVKPRDFSAQFFAVSSEPGQTRAEASIQGIQELNPNVKVDIDPENISEKPKSFFANFDVVFATDCPLNILISVNKYCRENSVQFYCGDTWGFYGYFFLDVPHHKYTRSFVNHVTKEENIVVEQMEFCPLGLVLGTKVGAGLTKKTDKLFFLLHIMNNYRAMFNRLPDPQSREEDIEQLKKIRSTVNSSLKVKKNKVSDEMLSCVFGELSPVCSAVGGVLSNEIIKCLSANGHPVQNFFLFDGDTSTGTVQNVVGQ